MKDSNELFELCKSVYEKTGWENDLVCCQSGSYRESGKEYGYFIYDDIRGYAHHQDKYPHTVGYTSDYLLEKLSAITDHVSVQRSNKISIDASNDEKSNWYAHYWLKSRRVQVKSDTPLKALLKLTLRLHEEKML